ncbi:large subunit GTPase 1 homolog [Diaphorina citri]|jgi:Predicted GTPases|uniref:Large subunit GTPase 1 homolog n=1 Tax=Diaphorina citri TaxID=121845 RepID=A0A1S3CZD6_DIACI|nr:large subunit GTPase 1 homolog [Diaphorina citri]
MGKKGGQNSLGKALIKNRFGHKPKRVSNDGLLHTSELEDGYDWNKINLKSVTEESSFQEFLSTAQLAGTEFTAEKLNITFVNPKSGVGLLSKEEKELALQAHKEKRELLKIPRRPKWDKNTTAEQLQAMERDEFLQWRRELNLLQEEDGLVITPYEKNLDFWRQLWRVIERSDVIVQIVDARNPLLFRCEDLERYVKEVSPHKRNMILLNKADLLTRKQRCYWTKYFNSVNVAVAFFSATNIYDDIPEGDEELEDEVVSEESESDESEWEDISEEEEEDDGQKVLENDLKIKSSPKLLNREELISLFKSFHDVNIPRMNPDVMTIGLVGYPNVGKSSTINALLNAKKVSVSATPGKTKHFQTLFVDDELLLCDCPGLVMPSFVFSKADMILNGILPIDQMRDHVPAVNMLCTLVPRHVLENIYGIMITQPDEGEDPNRPPFSEELCNAYGYNRGFMTSNGQPDNPRSARYILKDFVNGHLLYCQAPPGVPQEKYHIFKLKERKPLPKQTPRAMRALEPNVVRATDIDSKFFKKATGTALVKGRASVVPQGLGKGSMNASTMSLNTISSEDPKPWKQHKEKRNKREKLRKKPVSYY